MIFDVLGFRRALFLALVVTGCAESADPVWTHPTDNTQISVSLLFQHDGCRVYRFVDWGRYHYFANCDRGSATTLGAQDEVHGRTHEEVDEEIPTTRAKATKDDKAK